MRATEMHAPLDECLKRPVRFVHLELEFGAESPGFEFVRDESTGFAIDVQALSILLLPRVLEGYASIELPGLEALARIGEHRGDSDRNFAIARVLNENPAIETDGSARATAVACAMRLREELVFTSTDRAKGGSHDLHSK